MMRVIRYFSKTDEEYSGEIEMPHLPLDELQRIFLVSEENPMYDSFVVSEFEVECIAKTIGEEIPHEFQFDKYDYFLEYDA